ncbi:flavodoxin family protein [Clostridium sp.]|uniref:flavodoxin family protein n=1 Tax=Clostridium sp. TaxID=1506 RepID=UPI002FC91D96
MKIIVINGSPRANWNTSTLLKKAVEGATSKGAEVEIINLYKLNYKGCIGCFSCKRKGSKSLYNCAIKDDLTSVFEKIKNADAVIFGSPVYFYDITGEMRSFLERLLFPSLPYDLDVIEGTYFPKKLKTAFIYTMGAPEGMLTERLKPMENYISQIFRLPVKTLYSNSAYPFVDDYSKYEASDLKEMMIKYRDEVFPIDCEKAFSLGVDLVLDKN